MLGMRCDICDVSKTRLGRGNPLLLTGRIGANDDGLFTTAHRESWARPLKNRRIRKRRLSNSDPCVQTGDERYDYNGKQNTERSKKKPETGTN